MMTGSERRSDSTEPGLVPKRLMVELNRLKLNGPRNAFRRVRKRFVLGGRSYN